MIEHVVLTGGTGFIGRHFVHRLLSADRNLRVTLLVRGEAQASAEARVAGLLARVAHEYGESASSSELDGRLSVVVADITKPLCGLESEQISRLAGAGTAFWHLAASLNFEESQKDRIEALNVAGTNAALGLAHALGCAKFVYVSTAYSCGSATGSVAETLHDPAGRFGNAYERSKCLAEHLVAQRCTELAMAYRILRPSIVVGIEASGAPAGAETGLYGFCREVLRMKRVLTTHGSSIRVVGEAEAQVNLVPVDFVADSMVRLHLRGLDCGSVLHLASEGGPTVKDAVDAITDAVGVRRFHFVPALPGDASPLERLLEKRIEFYSSYMRGNKQFVAQLGGARRATPGNTRRYIQRFLAERSSNPHALVETTIRARDGRRLMVAATGHRTKPEAEAVVLVNAIGMPHATLDGLAAALASRYRVVTWVSRGAPFADGPLDDVSARFERHVDDLEDVLDALSIRRAHVIGWCTGSDVAIEFLSRNPDRALSLSCLNGGFVGLTSERLPYQRNIERIVRRVSRSATYARLYHALMTSADASTSEQSSSGTLPEEVRQTMACLSGDLTHITGAPLQSPETFQRYCVLLQHYFEEAPTRLPCATVPMFVGTAQDDTIVPTFAAQSIAQLYGRAEVYLAPRGGHFAPCVSPEMWAALQRFLSSVVPSSDKTRQEMLAA